MNAAAKELRSPDDERWALGWSYEDWFGPADIPAASALTGEIEIGTETPTALYRLFTGRRTLLYVGITSDLSHRFMQHAADKEWWPEVGRKTAVWYPTRPIALAAEARAIRKENPVHNRQRPEPQPELGFVAKNGFGARENAGDLLFFFRSITHATQKDLAAWQARMATTGAETLGEVILTMGRTP